MLVERKSELSVVFTASKFQKTNVLYRLGNCLFICYCALHHLPPYHLFLADKRVQYQRSRAVLMVELTMALLSDETWQTQFAYSQLGDEA